MTTIREPAEAIAISKCILARRPENRDYLGHESRYHPRMCNWCEWPEDVLLDWVREFNEWAGFELHQEVPDGEGGKAFISHITERVNGYGTGRFRQPAVADFYTQRIGVQLAAVRRAQYGPTEEAA